MDTTTTTGQSNAALSMPFANGAASEAASVGEQQKNVALEVRSLLEQSKVLSEQLKSAREELNRLNTCRPARPGSKPSAKERSQFEASLESWDGEVDSLRALIDSLNQDIADVYKAIGKCEEKLERLQTEQGAAVARDAGRVRMRQELEAARERLEDLADKLTADQEVQQSDRKPNAKHVEIKKVRRDIAFHVDDNSDLKNVIQAFALMVSVNGPMRMLLNDQRLTGRVPGGSLVLPAGEPAGA